MISDLVEPLVDKYEGGRESISTEDMIAKVVGLNETNMGWTKWSWYEGLEYEGYTGCGSCEGDWSRILDVEEPEVCRCTGVMTMDNLRVTARWLKYYRRWRWEKSVKWDPREEDRTWLSSEVLQEDLQDYQTPMVILGFDVVSLYPSMDIARVGDKVREAVLKSSISWEGINYMEAVRYIALNWNEAQCRASKLRRVLPWRRKSQGSRPGIRGAGPKGPDVGDTDQWVFPRVILSDLDKREILGAVLSIATTALFNHHFYSFGGAFFKQLKGGPIGLRGTCAVARLLMQVFDVQWEGVLRTMSIQFWLNTRYMDDGRTAMPPLKPGWRMVDGALKYCIKWEREDQELSNIEITKRVMLETLNGVDESLKFTIETEEDFYDGWLPTLDTKLKVTRSNQVLHGYFEKPTNSNVTLQRRTAMGEDSKLQILSNDLIRRLKNNAEELGEGAKVKIVDDYSQKLLNSGFRGEQLQRIVTNGIKGYESKLKRCMEQGRKLHRSSTNSQGARVKKKLLAKSSWFKRRKKREQDEKQPGGRTFGNKSKGSRHHRELEVKTVLFVEQSPRGELAKRLREAIREMEHTLGFRVKIVERTGRSLGSKFPLNNLWAGAKCGREDCITCEQGGEEELPPCTKPNLVYENICVGCNPGAKGRMEQEELKTSIPTVYIGETSRSIFERSKEHWEGARKMCGKNHMVKHQLMEHEGEQEPNFHMKVRGFYKTALARQVAEAVLIRRRGGEGAILNSRGEFSRCHIPRLQVVEEEQQMDSKEREQNTRLLREQDRDWEKNKAMELGAEAILGPGASPTKRPVEEEEGGAGRKSNKRRRKRWKHEVLEEGWGELPPTQGAGCGDTTAPTNPHILLTREQEQPSKPGELRGPPETASGRELDLKQLEITPFLNLVANIQEWPTTQNLADGIPPDPPATIISSGGSPRGGDGMVEMDGKAEGILLGGTVEEGNRSRDAQDLREGNTSNLRDAFEGRNVMQGGGNDAMIVRRAEPSVGGAVQTGADRKPSQDTMPGLALDKGPDRTRIDGISSKEKCEFRRGGRCILHGVVGTKHVEKSKVWAKKRDGTFGWKQKTSTRYVCQFDGCAESNVGMSQDDSRLEGVAKSNMKSAGRECVEQTTALGGAIINSGCGESLLGICENNYKAAGSFKSESTCEDNLRKDTD